MMLTGLKERATTHSCGMSYESDDNRGGMAERSLDLLLDGGSSSYIQIDL